MAPDTYSLNNAGYDYEDDVILGFSHTRIEGIGGSGGRGHITVSYTHLDVYKRQEISCVICSLFARKEIIG